MPIQISCPSCGRALRLPDELMGKQVRCPSCEKTFTAEESQAEGSPRPSSQESFTSDEGSGTERRRRYESDEEDRRRLRDEEDEENARWSRRSRRGSSYDRGHRGGLVMGLGIASVASAPVGLLLVICCGGIGMMVFGCLAIGLGMPAWIMGHNDLAAMRAGEMDRSGEGQTKGGWVCGIIGTVLGVMSLTCGGGLLIVGLAMMASGNF